MLDSLDFPNRHAIGSRRLDFGQKRWRLPDRLADFASRFLAIILRISLHLLDGRFHSIAVFMDKRMYGMSHLKVGVRISARPLCNAHRLKHRTVTFPESKAPRWWRRVSLQLRLWSSIAGCGWPWIIRFCVHPSWLRAQGKTVDNHENLEWCQCRMCHSPFCQMNPLLDALNFSYKTNL